MLELKMQKSRNITILIIACLAIYFYICQTILQKLGNTYVYAIKPVSFIGITLLFKFFINSSYSTNKYKKEIIQYVLITILLYIICYLTLGIFTGYGSNPYSSTIQGIVINLFVYAIEFCAIEYIRYKLIHNVYKKDCNLIFILIVLVFSIWNTNFFTIFTNTVTIYSVFKLIFYKILPEIAINILFTYLAINVDYVPAIIYQLLYHFMIWLSPILPKAPWVFEAMLNILFPTSLFIYIRYYINKKDRFHLNKINEEKTLLGFIPLAVIIIVIIWFVLGIFPIKPVGIATGSMSPELSVGDAAIIKKCVANDIEIQDIIEYQMEGYTVIHRVVDKYQEDGEIFFITKGDNNADEDHLPVSEGQLIGKVILKIRYIAFPSIWLHSLNSKQVIEIETGN